MKRVKLFIGLAFALIAGSASAQDFSDPQYAKWGETPEQRKENILASTFLKEELAKYSPYAALESHPTLRTVDR